MVDYYKILDVSSSSKTEVIKTAIKDKRRLWMSKTNSAQLERKQEAEMKVKQLDEAEKILLDDTKRNEYDIQLRKSAKDERSIDDTQLKDNEALIKQGWNFLINDRVADAIYVATRATEKDGANPEAWALLAQAKFRWDEIEDSIYEYKKAIKLKPNEPEYYFELGGVYESDQRWQEAVDNYEKASRIDPSVSVYRAAVGQVFLRLEMYNEAIPILENCVSEEPQNETYNWFLALAYNDLVVKSLMKPTSDGRFYIENKEAAENCVKYFDKALSLKFKDEDLRKLIKENLNYSNWCLEKHWGRPIGSSIIWVIVLGIFTIGMFATKSGGSIIVMLLIDAIWVFSGFKPGYKINRNSYQLSA